jgi:hypothetical protein
MNYFHHLNKLIFRIAMQMLKFDHLCQYFKSHVSSNFLVKLKKRFFINILSMCVINIYYSIKEMKALYVSYYNKFNDGSLLVQTPLFKSI